MRYYRIRLRDRSTIAAPDGTTDLLVVSNRPGDALPFLEGPPTGQGAELRVETGETTSGEYSGLLVDAKTGALTRVVTAVLENAQRQWQFASNRAYWEYADDAGPWQVLVAGYCTRLEQVDALTWTVAVGDTRRIERHATMSRLPAATFPLRGCIVGGPILGTPAWGPIVGDRGGWHIRVDSYDATTQTHVFEIERGYVGSDPEWRYLAGEGGRKTGGAVMAQLNDACRSLYDEGTGSFPTLRARVVTTGLDYTVLRTPGNSFLARASDLFGYSSTGNYPWMRVQWTGAPLTVGSRHRLHVYGAELTPATPVYWDGHPVDLFLALCAQEGIPVDAAAAAAVRTQLGDQLRYVRRFTAPFSLYDELRDALYQPFGVAVRMQAGHYAPAVVRLQPASTPSDTLVLDDLVEPDPALFRWTEDTIISDVVVSLTEYVSGTPTTAPFDGVVPAVVAYPITNPNPTPFGKRSLEVKVPGYYYVASAGGASSVTTGRSIARAIGSEIYNRFGAGCPSSDELLVRRSSPRAATPLGAELYLQLPQQPNANRRLLDDPSVGARIAQVVQRTEYDDVVGLRFLDSGSDAQPVTPAPVVALRADPDQPRTHAQAQITNAAAINATAVLVVEVETLTQVASPTTPGVVLVRFPEAACETGWFSLGRQPAGTRVWARARTRQVGRRPSAFTAWQSLDVGTLTAPTGLVATPVLGSTQVTLTWVPTALGNRSAVYLYQGAAAPGDWTPHLVQVCAPGDVRLDAETTAGSLPYQWMVRQLEADGTPGAAATGSFSSLALSLATGSVGGAGVAERLAKWLDATTIVDGPAVLDLSGLWPTSATLDLGTATNPWRHARLSGTLTAARALLGAPADPGSSYALVVNGLSRTSASGAVWHEVSQAGVANWRFGMKAGSAVPWFQLDGSDVLSIYRDGGGSGIANAEPYTSGALVYLSGMTGELYAGANEQFRWNTTGVESVRGTPTSAKWGSLRGFANVANTFATLSDGEATIYASPALGLVMAGRGNAGWDAGLYTRGGSIVVGVPQNSNQWWLMGGASFVLRNAANNASVEMRNPAGSGNAVLDISAPNGTQFSAGNVFVQGGAGLYVDGDARFLMWRNTALAEVVRIASERGWQGSGTNVTDGAIGFVGRGRIYANNSGSPALTVGAVSSATYVTAWGDFCVIGNFRRPDDAGATLTLGNGTNTHYAADHQIRDAAGSGWGTMQLGIAIFNGALASPGGGQRYIGQAGTSDSLWYNVPAGGTHYLGEADGWVLRLRTTGAEPGLSLTTGLLRASADFELLTFASAAQRLLTGGLLVSDSYADRSLVPANGIYSKGVLNVDRITARSTTVDSTFPGGLTGRGGRRVPELEWDSVAPSVARPAGTFHAQVI